MKNIKWIILSVIFSLAACSGSGGSDTPDVNPPTPPPVGGIGRTGIAQGPISTFGSVVVNGVRYDTSSAAFTVNGLSGSQDDLRVGQVITVSGTIDDNGVDGNADDVNFDDNVKGPIQSIDLGTSQIVVLGQTVLVNPETSFDDSISPTSIDGLSVDDIVEVSGLVDASGRITATRIELKPAGTEFEVLGIVSAHNSANLQFNINNLVDQEGRVEEESLEQFQRLLTALGLDPRFAGIAADWIDSNVDASFPDGAEDSIYTGMIPPYRTANQTLTSVSELAAIEGMDRATFRTLEPHITALPGRTGINANTATVAVLQSLDENMTLSDVEGLIQEREAGGFTEIETSFASLVTPDVLNRLEESSQFFRLKVIVRIDTVRVTLYSVLQRGPNGTVTPVLRSLGTS